MIISAAVQFRMSELGSAERTTRSEAGPGALERSRGITKKQESLGRRIQGGILPSPRRFKK